MQLESKISDNFTSHATILMYDLYQAPAIGTFSPANATVGTSIDNQAAPAAPMVGMVGVVLQPE